MSKKKISIQSTYVYEIEIDKDSPIVKDYDTQYQLIEDLASHEFKILPVIGNGVVILDVELNNFKIL